MTVSFQLSTNKILGIYNCESHQESIVVQVLVIVLFCCHMEQNEFQQE